MDKKWTFFLVVLGCLFVAALLFYGLMKFRWQQDELTAEIDGRHRFEIEIVTTPEQRSLGLGKRDGICEACGMLFVFDDPGKYSFWMKDMRFPLDILWIRGGEVVYIARNIPPDFPGTMRPPKDADQVLEINGGLCDKLGIKEGSRVIVSDT